MLKTSVLYLEEQKSFIPKPNGQNSSFLYQPMATWWRNIGVKILAPRVSNA